MQITPTIPAKPTAATYQRRKWQEPRPTSSYHHTLLNAARRSRYRPTKHTMRQMGRLLAFLGFSKMSADDKYRTVVSIWDYMEEYNNAFPFFCTDYVLSYRAVFDRQRMAMRLSIGDEQKFLKYCDAAQAADIKFSDGTWIPVPWMDEHWTRLNPLFAIPKYPYHFVHISEEDPLQVAYADSVDKLIADRFTRTKPGRYLMKFYGDCLGHDDEIRKWAERVQAMAAPAELAFIASDDPDGWKHVYREGPSSCMQGEDCVRVYAHDKSVLRLAHLVQGTTIKARCIVREDTKEYIRVYPNTDGTENNKWHMSLRERLEGLGYTHGDLEGVLLDCIDVGGGYLCPYIDSGAGSYMSASRVVRDGKSYLLLSRDGDWDAQNTSGIVNEQRCTCPECGDDYDDDDDFVYIEYRGESVCEHCANNNYTYAYVARRHQDYVPCDEAIYCESDGEYYARDYTDQADVYQCEVTGDWYALDDLCQTSRGMVHSDRCVALDVDDSDGNSYAYKQDAVKTHDGRMIHELDAETRDDGLVYHENDEQVETETEGE